MTRKPIPELEDEAEERRFWSQADSTEYLDWSKAQRITLPELRPTLKAISPRLPASRITDPSE